MFVYKDLIQQYLYKYFDTDKHIIFNNEKSIPITRSDPKKTIVELYIGYVLNKLSKKIPNFCIVRGLDIKNDVIYYCHTKNDISFREYLSYCSEIDFYKCILQLILALGKAQEKYRFNHNDLNVDNIFIIQKEVTNTYKFGSIVYELKTDIIPVITNYSKGRIQYDSFCVYYDNDPLYYDKSVDIITLIKSCIETIKNKDVSWLSQYIKFPQERINTLSFIDFFKYNKNNIFYSVVNISQRTLQSFTPYKYKDYISRSKVINNYVGINKDINNNYDDFLLSQYKDILKDIFKNEEKYSNIETVNNYTIKLYIIKSFIIYLRLKDKHIYYPQLFTIKQTLLDKIDYIKISNLSYLYNNQKKCISADEYNKTNHFYPLMYGLIHIDNICKK